MSNFIFTEHYDIHFRYLAPGDSYTNIASSYRVGISTVADTVPDVSKATALWMNFCLYQRLLIGRRLPRASRRGGTSIAVWVQWMGNMAIQAPHNSGSQYFNYMGTFTLLYFWQ